MTRNRVATTSSSSSVQSSHRERSRRTSLFSKFVSYLAVFVVLLLLNVRSSYKFHNNTNNNVLIIERNHPVTTNTLTTTTATIKTPAKEATVNIITSSSEKTVKSENSGLLAIDSANSTNERISKGKAVIAYAISLTSCNDDKFVDGAAVLKHSIHLSSIRNPSSGSQYSYKLYAIVHPQAGNCYKALIRIGYEILVRDTPIDVSKIRGDFLRKNVVKSGCCGEKEFIKLWAYTLLEHPVVVHLDSDTLLLRPMDELFDAIIEGPPQSVNETSSIQQMFDGPLPKKINAFFTRDYNMVDPPHEHVGIQGGFFVIRPSQEAFREYLGIILDGNFVRSKGWDGKYGGYYGAQQIQGLMSYYHDGLHPGTAVELNRCIYDAMADSPKAEIKDKKTGEIKEMCKDGTDECEDCRLKDMSEIKLIHFTECFKPWRCPGILNWEDVDGPTKDLCDEFHREWFHMREKFERSHGTFANKQVMKPETKFRRNVFLGYCAGEGTGGYIPLNVEE